MRALMAHQIMRQVIQFWEADYALAYSEIYYTSETMNSDKYLDGADPEVDSSRPNFDGSFIKSGRAGVPCAGPWDTECVEKYMQELGMLDDDGEGEGEDAEASVAVEAAERPAALAAPVDTVAADEPITACSFVSRYRVVLDAPAAAAYASAAAEAPYRFSAQHNHWGIRVDDDAHLRQY